jgi:protein SCO1/2
VDRGPQGIEDHGLKRLVAVFMMFAAACSRLEPLPVYGQVPPFELTGEDGRTFASHSLNGQVWVADFIFTTCSGPCPRMSTLMRQVQNSVASMPGVQLVSFTVDPARDTPEVLAAYAKRYNAQAGRWHFLTGPQATLHGLKREAFKLGSVDGSLNHSTRLVLIDPRGRVRGYYGTEEESPVRRLVVDIQRVRKEKA